MRNGIASLGGICLLVLGLVLAASFRAAASDAPPATAAGAAHAPALPTFLYGTINQVNGSKAVINQIPFDFDPNQDISPGRFFPGNYVFFRLGSDKKIVMIERTEQATGQVQVSEDLLHQAAASQAVGAVVSPAAPPETSPPPASAPPDPATPVKEHGGTLKD